MEEHTCIRCLKKFRAIVNRGAFNPLCSLCSGVDKPTFERAQTGYKGGYQRTMFDKDLFKLANTDTQYLESYKLNLGGA